MMMPNTPTAPITSAIGVFGHNSATPKPNSAMRVTQFQRRFHMPSSIAEPSA